MVGLVVTLGAVTLFCWYALQQIDGLRRLQAQTIDTGRKDSLQLLRIQNNLHSLALSMRDMTEGDSRYPLEAWQSEFDRIHFDLNDALETERRLAPASRAPEQQDFLARSLEQYWIGVQEVFELAKQKREEEAKERIRTVLQPRHASVATTVARFLVMNNESEEAAVEEIAGIYAGVERNIYYFLAATIVAICATSSYLILHNRRTFEKLTRLSGQRQFLARKLISVQEDLFHSVSRELHDEFGQILTAVGVMLQRAKTPDLPPEAVREQLADVQNVAQKTLDKVRSLSQQLHPSILDDYGLEGALEWYVEEFRKQTGLAISYQKEGSGPPVPTNVAIHVYRILQEALNNVVRHADSSVAWVRLQMGADRIELEVEDRGVGLKEDDHRGGLGLVAMRERCALIEGLLEFRRPAEGGTLLRLEVPLRGGTA